MIDRICSKCGEPVVGNFVARNVRISGSQIIGGQVDHVSCTPKADTRDATIQSLREELAAKEAENTVAPAECDPNCDDPHCHYSHQPLTLRQAYENSVERLRNAEATLTTERTAREAAAAAYRTEHEQLLVTETALAEARAKAIEECARFVQNFERLHSDKAARRDIVRALRALAKEPGR